MGKKHFTARVLPSVLLLFILLQGCSVYQKTSVTLDDAVKSNSKVRIEGNNNKRLDLKNVEQKDGAYYGFKNNGATTPVVLDEKEIKSVHLIDKSKSDLGTILAIGGTAALLGLFLLAATFTVF